MIFISVDFTSAVLADDGVDGLRQHGERRRGACTGPKLLEMCRISSKGAGVGSGSSVVGAHVQEAAALHLRGQAVFRGWMDSSWAAQGSALSCGTKPRRAQASTVPPSAWVGGVSVGEREADVGRRQRARIKPNRSRGLSQVERLRRSIGSAGGADAQAHRLDAVAVPVQPRHAFTERAWRRRSCHRAGARSRA